ncbi:hypothetical protein HDU96_008696, partial [Phlyctochytrium bullatum]
TAAKVIVIAFGVASIVCTLFLTPSSRNRRCRRGLHRPTTLETQDPASRTQHLLDRVADAEAALEATTGSSTTVLAVPRTGFVGRLARAWAVASAVVGFTMCSVLGVGGVVEAVVGLESGRRRAWHARCAREGMEALDAWLRLCAAGEEDIVADQDALQLLNLALRTCTNASLAANHLSLATRSRVHVTASLALRVVASWVFDGTLSQPPSALAAFVSVPLRLPTCQSVLRALAGHLWRSGREEARRFMMRSAEGARVSGDARDLRAVRWVVGKVGSATGPADPVLDWMEMMDGMVPAAVCGIRLPWLVRLGGGDVGVDECTAADIIAARFRAAEIGGAVVGGGSAGAPSVLAFPARRGLLRRNSLDRLGVGMGGLVGEAECAGDRTGCWAAAATRVMVGWVGTGEDARMVGADGPEPLDGPTQVWIAAEQRDAAWFSAVPATVSEDPATLEARMFEAFTVDSRRAASLAMFAVFRVRVGDLAAAVQAARALDAWLAERMERQDVERVLHAARLKAGGGARVAFCVPDGARLAATVEFAALSWCLRVAMAGGVENGGGQLPPATPVEEEPVWKAVAAGVGPVGDAVSIEGLHPSMVMVARRGLAQMRRLLPLVVTFAQATGKRGVFGEAVDTGRRARVMVPCECVLAWSDVVY